jgi:chromosome segregation ATPase
VVRAGQAGRPVQSADPTDLSADAYALADYGEPPESWFVAPMYAWRVLKRQRELKAALVGRQAEAQHAVTAVEEALVGFAERVRPAAEKGSGYAIALEDLSRAEDVLRSRDNVLAAEQDAQKARLAQVDARLAATENELVDSQTNERLLAQDLASAQAGLAREEAKLKRAESELKSVTARTSSSGAS